MKRIISMLVLALVTSCTQPNVIMLPSTAPTKTPVQSSNTNKIDASKPIIVEVKPDVKISAQPIKPIENNTKIGVKIDQYGTTVELPPTPQPTTYYNSQPLPTPTPSTLYYQGKPIPNEPSDNPIDFKDKPFGYYSDPNYGRKYPYRQVNETPKNVRDGSISITFKDEYKIRLKNYLENFSKYQKKVIDMTVEEREELVKNTPLVYEFSSLDKNIIESKKNELNQLNEILKKYKVVSVGLGSGIADGEEEALKDEKTLQRISDSGDHGYDEANTYSHYKITVKDTDIYNLVNELRNIEIVRECNYNFGVSVG